MSKDIDGDETDKPAFLMPLNDKGAAGMAIVLSALEYCGTLYQEITAIPSRKTMALSRRRQGNGDSDDLMILKNALLADAAITEIQKIIPNNADIKNISIVSEYFLDYAHQLTGKTLDEIKAKFGEEQAMLLDNGKVAAIATVADIVARYEQR